MRRYNIGDKVIIRDDLEVGKLYYTINGRSDVFTKNMVPFMGKEATVIGYNKVGYRLDIDPLHNYTDEMLMEPEYAGEFEEEADAILSNSMLDYYRNKIDEALDSNMYQENPEDFNKLVEEYKQINEKIKQFERKWEKSRWMRNYVKIRFENTPKSRGIKRLGVFLFFW